MLPCVCSELIKDVKDYREHLLKHLVTHMPHRSCAICFFALTLFWRHLLPITEQTHGNKESIC